MQEVSRGKTDDITTHVQQLRNGENSITVSGTMSAQQGLRCRENVESESKRMKLGLKNFLSPSRFKNMRSVDITEADYNDSDFEFATLSSGKTILITREIWTVNYDGTFEGPGALLDFHIFARVPGRDFIVSTLSFYYINRSVLRIGVLTIPDLRLVSTLELNMGPDEDGHATNICADNSSPYGVGRVLVSTQNVLFLLDVSEGGQLTIRNVLDSTACVATVPLKTNLSSNSAFTYQIKLYFYHDPSGNPIAILCVESGRVVFLSMTGPQCIPSEFWIHGASGTPILEGMDVTLESICKASKVEVNTPASIPQVNLKSTPKHVKPLRVLHAHDGRTTGSSRRSQNDAIVYYACIWQSTTAPEGRKLITIGTDSLVAISNLDDGTSFSSDTSPYKVFKSNTSSNAPATILAVVGDIAFTSSSAENKGTFWDLTKDSPDNKLFVTKKFSDGSNKFRIMRTSFSSHGILAYTNSNNDCSPVLTFFIPKSDA